MPIYKSKYKGSEIDNKLDEINTIKADIANQIVADITARNAISSDARRIGMEVKVLSDGKKYQLLGGTTNANWSEVVTNTNEAEVNALITEATAEMSATIISTNNYYKQCTSTDTGALLVVASGATTGQINVASVTPCLSDYTPTAGHYIHKVSDVLSANPLITQKMTLVMSNNVYNPTDWTSGIVNTAGEISAHATYTYSKKIAVTAGDVVRCYSYNSLGLFTTSDMRMVTAYNASQVAVTGSGQSTAAATYTVPSGISYVVISANMDSMTMITINYVATKYEQYFAPYYEADNTFVKNTLSALDSINNEVSTSYDVRVDSDMVVAEITLGTVNDTFYIVNNIGNGSNCRLMYVNFSTKRIGTTLTTNPSVIPATYGFSDTLTLNSVVGRKYSIVSKKIDAITFSITLTDMETLESQTYSSSYDQGGGNGIRQYLTSGSPTVNTFKAYSTQKKQCKVLFIGDSFIEGNHLGVSDKDKRYCALAKTHLNGDCFISGHPGKTISEIFDAYKTYVKDICKPTYIFIAGGTNDTVFATYISALKEFIKYVIADGIIPILPTITPSGIITNVAASANPWIRNSGYRYVDFGYMFSSGHNDRTLITSMTTDNCHPTINAYTAMFKRMQIDVPEVFA